MVDNVGAHASQVCAMIRSLHHEVFRQQRPKLGFVFGRNDGYRRIRRGSFYVEDPV